ncbi:hypothetical protein EG329_001323 [Mollisiaceae sp. DMI_Dod_QoI]|nr:hypothetical protein EG329_001323 [Helotiales sp. DMI_Dod_QoI]
MADASMPSLGARLCAESSAKRRLSCENICKQGARGARSMCGALVGGEEVKPAPFVAVGVCFCFRGCSGLWSPGLSSAAAAQAARRIAGWQEDDVNSTPGYRIQEYPVLVPTP